MRPILITYLVVIFVVLTLATIQLFRERSFPDKNNRNAYYFLWFFVLCNVLSEYFAVYVLYHNHENNEYIYGYSIVAHTPALFVFYGCIVKKRLLHLSSFIGLTLMLIVFFADQYWKRGVIIYVFHIAGYYTIMSIVSLIFLWYIMKDPEYRKNTFTFRVAIMLSIYFSIAFLVIPVNFVLERYAGEMFFYYAALVMNICYYSIFSTILFLNIKNNKYTSGIS